MLRPYVASLTTSGHALSRMPLGLHELAGLKNLQLRLPVLCYFSMAGEYFPWRAAEVTMARW